jgi:antirestriction protein ArdC
MAADERKFEHQVFATYKQWQELGAQVQGGEKGSMIIKVGDWIPRPVAGGHPKGNQKGEREKRAQAGDDGDEETAKRLYAKPAFVFNIDQVEAPVELRARLLPATAPRRDLTVRLAHVDAFI